MHRLGRVSVRRSRGGLCRAETRGDHLLRARHGHPPRGAPDQSHPERVCGRRAGPEHRVHGQTAHERRPHLSGSLPDRAWRHGGLSWLLERRSPHPRHSARGRASDRRCIPRKPWPGGRLYRVARDRRRLGRERRLRGARPPSGRARLRSHPPRPRRVFELRRSWEPAERVRGRPRRRQVDPRRRARAHEDALLRAERQGRHHRPLARGPRRLLCRRDRTDLRARAEPRRGGRLLAALDQPGDLGRAPLRSQLVPDRDQPGDQRGRVWYHYTHSTLLDGPDAGLEVFAAAKAAQITNFENNDCWGQWGDLEAAGTTAADLFDPAFVSAVAQGRRRRRRRMQRRQHDLQRPGSRATPPIARTSPRPSRF